MKLEEVTNLITQLERELFQVQKDLEVAKKFRDVLGRKEYAAHAGNGSANAVQIPLVPESIDPTDYSQVADAVRSAIPYCPDNYSIDEIENVLLGMNKRIPRPSLSQAVYRLSRAGEIAVKTPGQGRRPTVFVQNHLRDKILEEL